jgi:hypothetical protein
MIYHECRNEIVRVVVTLPHIERQPDPSRPASALQKLRPKPVLQELIRRSLIDQKLWNAIAVLDETHGVVGAPTAFIVAQISQIAKAMTGTNWNGHRFFGLRQGKTPVADARRQVWSRILAALRPFPRHLALTPR